MHAACSSVDEINIRGWSECCLCNACRSTRIRSRNGFRAGIGDATIGTCEMKLVADEANALYDD